MKRIIMLIIFLSLSVICIAPINKHLIIFKSKPVSIFNADDNFLRSVIYYESRFNVKIVNKVSGAKGILQITKVMIKEVNKICRVLKLSNHYTWNDAFDPIKSIEIWYIVQNHKNPEYYFDKACRIWFGTGMQYDGMRWEDYYNDVMDIFENFNK